MMIWLWTLATIATAAAVWAVVSAVRAGARAKRRASAAPEKPVQTTIAKDGPRLPMRSHGADPVHPHDDPNDASRDPVLGVVGPRNIGDALSRSRVREWSEQDLGWLLREEKPPSRRVMTPNGPMELTSPPFRLRASVLSSRERWYARSISVKLPSGFVVCPKVRLESLLDPLPPDDRSVEDWREWRQRVRLRAVDFVICRMPDWEPVVAVLIDAPERSASTVQTDRLIDETLAQVGLPFIRCSGSPRTDWPMIAPYVKRDRSTA